MVPERLNATCHGVPERVTWLQALPGLVEHLASRWSLVVGQPFDHEDANHAWVAPVSRSDGNRAVLKIGVPHLESEQEIDGLRFWAGNPTVHLLDADVACNAMLLERCDPGTSLRQLPEPEQDRIVAALLRRLWRTPPHGQVFRHLSVMTNHWCDETRAGSRLWPDAALVRDGLRLFELLSAPSPDDVLLATDVHAGNVLRAQREPWLVIDPKPFVGDRAYDATQHLFNCRARLQSAAERTIRGFADDLGVDHLRVRQWMFARAAAEPRDRWNARDMAVARQLAM